MILKIFERTESIAKIHSIPGELIGKRIYRKTRGLADTEDQDLIDGEGRDTDPHQRHDGRHLAQEGVAAGP